ncbi:unnamed protein product [Ambrosiozyma monospora]|uniref:Unnamed protein product n=1 Tax=Ambrosiozyma monospora TaxID=43982 RepID=A0A9W7DH08_AMBMO|nr:unnamed protein product [Ambrosiozyma monospora]
MLDYSTTETKSVVVTTDVTSTITASSPFLVTSPDNSDTSISKLTTTSISSPDPNGTTVTKSVIVTEDTTSIITTRNSLPTELIPPSASASISSSDYDTTQTELVIVTEDTTSVTTTTAQPPSNLSDDGWDLASDWATTETSSPNSCLPL